MDGSESSFTHSLEHLKKIWEDDCRFDTSRIDEMISSSGKLHSKYYNILIDLALKVDLYQTQYDTVVRERTDYLLGKSPPDVYKQHPLNVKIIKTEVNSYLKADPTVNKAKLKLALAQKKVDFVEDVLKMIHQRGFQVKAYIDWQKFKNGGH